MPFLTVPEEEVAMGILEAGITALLGYAAVFSGLILLMVVVILVGKYFAAKTAKEEAAAAAPVAEEVPAVPAEPAADAPVAPGAAGDVKLHNVDPKTAAMLMAIVADKMQKPINELRFISIKEVE